MKKFSGTFREALREDRQLNAIVSYKTDQTFMILTTQDDKNLLAENNDFLATQQGFLEYDKEAINSVNPLYNARLLKTTCKSIQIDSNNEIAKGTWVNVKIGVYKEDTNNYEYLDYGNYYVNDEPTFQADSNSYLIVAYDRMIESMISYDDNPLSITYPIKHKDLVIAICNKFNWRYNLGNYPNYNKDIPKDLYAGQNLTYRDILDDLNGVCGGSFMFDLQNNFVRKIPTETNQIVEDNDLKDSNIDFSEKYGKVNALTITTNGNVVLDSRQDDVSIQQNGKTEFNINDNYILNYSTEDFIDNIFNEINGLEYYLYDIDSTGLLIFDPLDIFTFRHDGIDYKTIMFNDDIKLTQGLVETTFAERPEEAEKDYKTTDKDKNKLNNAIISIDKANAEIVLKVDSDGKIVQVKLSGNADDGTTFNVKADNIKLEGYTTINNNFTIDEKGNMSCNDAIIKGIINGGIIRSENFSLSNNVGMEINLSTGEIVTYEPIKFKDGTAYSTTIAGRQINTETLIASYTLDGELYHTTKIYGGNITCEKLTQTSLKEYKKNFKKYSGALKELDKIDIYKYNLKNENDDDKKHLGFVIGDNFNYSEIVTSNDNKGVDNYSFTSLCFQMIKEQQEQIKNLQNQINELKESE